MWRPLDFKDYVLKTEKFHDGWIICISDFVRIWSRILKNEDVIAIFKRKKLNFCSFIIKALAAGPDIDANNSLSETNPLIEVEFNDKLIKKVISLFDGQVKNKKLERNGDQLLIELESDLSGVKFYFKLELKQLEADKFFKDITLPFILLAANLKIRENKLLDIIKKKDDEISEYKQENAVIKRSHLITKEFCVDEFTKQGLEETCSSLSKIRKNPSLILDIISADVLETSVNNSLQGDEVCEMEHKNSDSLGDGNPVGANSKNVSNNKRNLQNGPIRTKKPRNKVEVQINSCAKRRTKNYPALLKF